MKITGHTQLIGFFADPAKHSQSPLIYNTAFEKLNLDYAYLAFTIPEGRIEDAVKAMKLFNMKGCNVSMPHKQAIIPYLDEVSERVKICDAVNTVVNENGKLKGYNTDILGASKAIENTGVNIGESIAVVLGLGGAGKAVLTGLAMERAKKIYAVIRGKTAFDNGENANRYNAESSIAFAEKIRSKTGAEIEIIDTEDLGGIRTALKGSQILVNCTNLGMGKYEGLSPLPEGDYMHSDLTVMDAIYFPKKSRLLEQAEEAGCKTYINGIDMLLFQGQEAFRLFTGEELPIDDVRAAFNRN